MVHFVCHRKRGFHWAEVLRKLRETTEQQRKKMRKISADSDRTLQSIRSTVNMVVSYRDAPVRSSIIIAFPPTRSFCEETEGQTGSNESECSIGMHERE